MIQKYRKTFISQEFKTILGKRWGNFWILFFIFLITIGSLSFSRAGLEFLRIKMSDPFIQWVEVKEQKNFKQFKDEANIQKNSFNISTIEENNYILEYVLDRNFQYIRVEGRTIAYNSDLLKKITQQGGIVQRIDPVQEKDFGWIVTTEMLKKLGYTNKENYPLFLNFTFKGEKENIQHFGISAYGRDTDFIVIPIPIIAVVDRLPNMLDFITTNNFFEQLDNSNLPFNISIHEEYYNDLYFVVKYPDQNFEDRLKSHLDKSGLKYDIEPPENYNLAFEEATKYRIIIRKMENPEDTTNTLFYHKLNAVANEICKDSAEVYRYYDYAFNNVEKIDPDYLSFLFSDLSKVKDFADWAFQNHEIKIEMTQIEAKKNFDTFHELATLLSISIIIISIIVVSIFLSFLINSHFQKISKNLGTIMAFGLENKSIVSIYLVVFLLLVMGELGGATLLLFVTQAIFNLTGFVRELNNLPYINMCDWLVLSVLIGVLILSVIVTDYIMHKKLKATPGDLIFDRNN